MNPRHRNNNLSHIETQTLLLLDFVVNKATQSRRLVQQSALVELIKVVWSLWYAVCDILDGVDSRKTAIRLVHKVVRGAFAIGYVESRNPKKMDSHGKPKKHYGFDTFAVAYIDELCDDLIAQISAFGQFRQPQHKGQDESTV